MQPRNVNILFCESINGYIAELRDDGMLLLTKIVGDVERTLASLESSEITPHMMPLYSDVITGELWIPSFRSEFVNSVRDGLEQGIYNTDNYDICGALLESLVILPKLPIETTPAPVSES